MATGQITVSSGIGVNIATHTITEDALTKHLQRTVLTTQDGSIFGSVTIPIGVSVIGAIPTTTSGNTSVSGQIGASVLGTVPVVQSGTQITSLVSTVPSSVLVGASIMGTVPMVQSGTWIQSVVGAMAGTSSVYAVLSSITSVSILSANANRKGAVIYNAAGTTVYVKLGTAATTSMYTVQMAANDYYELPTGWTGVVAGITASNAGIINVTELT